MDTIGTGQSVLIIEISLLFPECPVFTIIHVHVISVFSCYTGVIDVGAEWASDLKEGVCPSNFYYDRDSCCWLSNETFSKDGSCANWNSWAHIYGIHPLISSYLLNYFIYVSFAVGFGGMAGLFVIRLAPYAAGSGIPEVNLLIN